MSNNEFGVKVELGSMFYRIQDMSHPHARLLPDFDAGYFKRETQPASPELFNNMNLVVHVDPERVNTYGAQFQALYEDPTKAIWRPNEVDMLAKCLTSHGYPSRRLLVEDALPFILTTERDNAYLVHPFSSGFGDQDKRSFEIEIAHFTASKLKLDPAEEKFKERVNLWARFIKATIDYAALIKQVEQTGTLNIGTLHFRNFIDPEIEAEFGV